MRYGPFRLPTDRNWSKQHPKIRTPRPLVDRFNLGNLHPNKEWWRERRIAPATFMGFPDVTKAELRGGSLYTEQMDAPTLAVILDRCVKEGIVNPEFWAKFSWRAQQICPTVGETDLAYLFRAFSKADWVDSHLLLSLWGRTDWLLPKFGLADLAVLVEGYANPNFRNERYELKVLNHLLLLVQARQDWTTEELCKAVSVVHYSGCDRSLELRREFLSTAGRQIVEQGDLSVVSVRRLAQMMHVLAQMPDNAQLDLIYAILNDLKESGKLLDRKREDVGDQAVSLVSSIHRLGMADIERALLDDLLLDYYDNIYRLSHDSLVQAVRMVSQSGFPTNSLPGDHLVVLLRRVSREAYKLSNEQACVALAELVNVPAGGEEVEALRKEAVSECVSRLANIGIEKVSKDVLLHLQDRLQRCPELVAGDPELATFVDVLQLCISE